MTTMDTTELDLTTTLDYSNVRGTFIPYSVPEDYGNISPFGVLQAPNGKSAKKRCRCIEKKQRKVVKEIKFIPLAPAIQFPGEKRNFTCNCSHLRRVAKNKLKTAEVISKK